MLKIGNLELEHRAANLDELMAGLPGESLVREGLADFQARRCTIPACLVQMARPRFDAAGLLAGTDADLVTETELQVYRMLCEQGGDAYSRYNALLRELVSFEQALDHRTRKQKAENKKQK